MIHIIATTTNDQEQEPTTTRTRASTNTDRTQRSMAHEYVVAHTRDPSVMIRPKANGIDSSINADPTVRRRTTIQNTRSNTITKDAIIEFTKDSSVAPDRRRTSHFLGKPSLPTSNSIRSISNPCL